MRLHGLATMLSTAGYDTYIQNPYVAVMSNGVMLPQITADMSGMVTTSALNQQDSSSGSVSSDPAYVQIRTIL